MHRQFMVLFTFLLLVLGFSAPPARAEIGYSASSTSTAHTSSTHALGIMSLMQPHAVQKSARALIQQLSAHRQSPRLLDDQMRATSALLKQLNTDESSTRPRSDHSRADATTASQLALPENVVTSGKGVQGPVGTGQGPFHLYHQGYSGFQSAVAATFDFKPVVTIFYQGSVFSDAGSADAYVQNASLGAGTTFTDCSSTVNVPCKLSSFLSTDNQLSVYTVARINYCVIEVGYQGDSALIKQNSDAVNNAAANVFVLGVGLAKAACTGSSPNAAPGAPTPTSIPSSTPIPSQTVYNIVSVRFEKAGTIPKLSNSAIRKAKVGSKVNLAFYFNVTSALPQTGVTITSTLSRGKTRLVNKTSTSALDSTNPTGTYSDNIQFKLPKKAGKYKGTVTVSIGGQTQSGSATLKVVKK